MKIIFRDLHPAVVEAMQAAFADVPEFDIACADIFSAGPADAIISPANSHGYMDGGIDLVYLHRFGFNLQTRLRTKLAAYWQRGFLPVGEAETVPTFDRDIPVMISAPTMETPGPVPDTDNAYLAFRAALRVIRAQGHGTVLCPGLATLTGRMAPSVSAEQMRRAWDEVMA